MNTRFWEDLWVGDSPLSRKFPRLYNLVCKPGITVAKVFAEGWGGVRFRRTLVGEMADLWLEVQLMCGDIVLTDNRDRDKCRWMLKKSGFFLLSLCITQ